MRQIVTRNREPHRLGTGRQHDEAIEPERNAGALRQPVLQGGEEVLIDRIHLTVERLLPSLIGRETRALFGGVGQFAKSVGEFETADIKLEPFRKPGILGLAARQRRHSAGTDNHNACWRRFRFARRLFVNLAGYEKALATFLDLVASNVT